MSDKPFGWVTPESISRLARGGNCKGTVPVHLKESRVATLAVYASPQVFGRKDICQFCVKTSEQIDSLEYAYEIREKQLVHANERIQELEIDLRKANKKERDFRSCIRHFIDHLPREEKDK